MILTGMATEAHQNEEKALHEELYILSHNQEAISQQKSRVQWLKLGDQNTNYFHRTVNSITLSYFQGHLGMADPQLQWSPAQLANILCKVLPPQTQNSLCSPITREKIRRTLHSLNGNKAPGPDHFTAQFFKNLWEITNESIIVAVQQFFSLGSIPRQVNAAILALIPKKPNLSHVSDYRPISYCTTIDKCVVKILANRIHNALPHLISQNQAAFIRGRSISDNILLAHELVHNYHWTGISLRSVVKIDLHKAFDSFGLAFHS